MGATLAAKKWKAMSENARKPFEEKAAAKKAEYAKALEAFKAAGGKTSKRKAANKMDKSEKRAAKKARRESGQPKRPPTAYQVFADQIRAEAMACRWKTASAADRAKCHWIAEEKHGEYKAAIEAWKVANRNGEQKRRRMKGIRWYLFERAPLQQA